MKILFLYENFNDEPLGLMHLSSALKENGHKTRLFIFDNSNSYMKEVRRFKPDVVAATVTTGMHKQYVAIMERIKEEFNIFSILGGPHPTFFPNIINEDSVDAICIGEGEHAIVELCNALCSDGDITKIRNIWVKKDGKIYKNPLRPLIQNLDSLPFPDRELVRKYFGRRETRHFLATRGCPYSCTYCFNHTLKKMYPSQRFVRRRSVPNVIDEMKEVRDKNRSFKTVRFFDDTFILDKKWLRMFLKEYKKEIDMPFSCNARPNLIDDEVCMLLKNAGCFEVGMGIEAGNEHIRNNVLKRGVSNEQIINAGKLLNDFGINLLTNNMVGIPGETLENVFESIRMNAQVKPYYAWCSIFQPYPKTELGEYALKKYCNSASIDDIYANYHKSSILDIKSKSQIENLHKFFALCVNNLWMIPMVKVLIKLPPNQMFFLFYRWYKSHKKSIMFR